MVLLAAAFMLPAMVRGFSATNRIPPTAVALDRNVAQQDKAFAIDQAAWTSSRFWLDFENELKAAGVARHGDGDVLARFDSFTHNLKTEKPGDIVTLPNGQELHKQYIYPGLDREWHRIPFPPVDTVPGTSTLASCAAIARDELIASLANAPLRNDDGADSANSNPTSSDGTSSKQADTPWNRAAWYGWQFLPLRAEQHAFHGTIAQLKAGQVPLGHRFVGVARQRANCRGTVHSDHRNYMLSTLTPLVVPGANTCGVMGYSQESAGSSSSNKLQSETKILDVGETIVLDNSFPHEVYNDGDTDRFVLMAEVWHPGLSPVEQVALETLFACRDRFALFEFADRPWGMGQKELMAAIESGKVEDIDFWKQVSDSRPSAVEVASIGSREVLTSVDQVKVMKRQAPNDGQKNGKPKRSGVKTTKTRTNGKRGFGA